MSPEKLGKLIDIRGPAARPLRRCGTPWKVATSAMCSTDAPDAPAAPPRCPPAPSPPPSLALGRLLRHESEMVREAM